jgi:hypothetical protein
LSCRLIIASYRNSLSSFSFSGKKRCSVKASISGVIKTGVLGLVHHSHAIAAELLYNPIVRDGFADQLERDSRPVE